MILREDCDKYTAKIEELVAKADIQWWIYKSVLCKQPLSKFFFNSWYNLFNKFHLILDKYAEDTKISREDLNFLKSIKSNLEKNVKSLERKVSEESINELNNMQNKLNDIINELIELIMKHSEEVLL